MSNGATIYLEAAWALNITDAREASTTLCGTKAGAEVVGGIAMGKHRLTYNKTSHGQLTEEIVSSGTGAVAFFEGAGGGAPEDLEASQWLKAIVDNGKPLVKPEEAFTVTRILEAIYRSAETGKEVYL